jgi:hypothetical protein
VDTQGASRRRPDRHALLRVWLVALIAALSPLWMGPLLTPLRVAVAGLHHVCACGMAVGTCGCHACEVVELRRQAGEPGKQEPSPVLKGECGKGEAVLGDTHVPPAIPAAPESVIALTVVPATPAALRPGLRSLAPPPPPTPPPRSSTKHA